MFNECGADLFSVWLCRFVEAQNRVCSVQCQVWDRRVETVKSKLSAVEMDLLKILRPVFFFFTGLPGEIDFLLQSQTVWFLSLLTSNMAGTTASYVFVKYLNCCQNKSIILISAVIISTQISLHSKYNVSWCGSKNISLG